MRARQLRLHIERLGPAFVKVAQALSTRVDLLDANYLTQIELLQVGIGSAICDCLRCSITCDCLCSSKHSRAHLDINNAPKADALTADAPSSQDRVPPFPTEDALEVMQQAWGRPVNVVLSKISDEPVAAASLGQVWISSATINQHWRSPGLSNLFALMFQRIIPHECQSQRAVDCAAGRCTAA